MIEQINQRTLIHLGSGTLSLGLDKDEEVYIIYEKPFNPVGDKININVGKTTEELDKPVIEFRFDGVEAVKSLDIIIEDLTLLKSKLTQQKEV